MVFQIRATNKLSYLFRALFVVCFVATTTQSIHYFTPGHPALHLFGGTAVWIMVGIVVICQLQILKTFTVMTTFLTDRKISIVQVVYLCWGFVLFLLSSVFVIYLGKRAPEELTTVQQLLYQLFILFAAIYETWNALFISYLILKHSVTQIDRNSDQESRKTNIWHGKRKLGLLVYLAFMLFFLWFGMAMWALAYALPVQTDPWETFIRILGNHIGIWYPVWMYYFFQLLKKVQFETIRGSSLPITQVIRNPKVVQELAREVSLCPTRLMERPNLALKE
jgi:hypothetical protein